LLERTYSLKIGDFKPRLFFSLSKCGKFGGIFPQINPFAEVTGPLIYFILLKILVTNWLKFSSKFIKINKLIKIKISK